MSRPLFGAVEGGGTWFRCAVGYGPQEILAQERYPTTTPAETLSLVAQFLRAAGERQQDQLAAVGVSCFGPLELHRSRPAYGSLLSTPKPHWSHAPVAGPLHDALDVPVAIDTDVNGAALAEWLWGAAQGCDPALYLTIGTGIGGGAVVDGRPLHGLLHPEMGHIILPRQPWPDGRPDDFPGACPFHGACFEGLVAGPALERRLGARPDTLPADHPLWELVAAYVAVALATYVLVLSPQRIVVGGGVMQQAHLFDRVRARLSTSLAQYVDRAEVGPAVASYVVPPHFADAGLIGAFALAQQAR